MVGKHNKTSVNTEKPLEGIKPIILKRSVSVKDIGFGFLEENFSVKVTLP